MPKPFAAALAHKVESIEALDPIGKTIGKAVRSALPAGKLKDLISGVPIGHALHPLLTDVVIGTWMSAVLLDAVGGKDAEPASQKLIAAGLASTGPVLITGWSDWADTEIADDGVRRVGLVHASTNAVAINLMAVSLLARRKDQPGKGKLLALAAVSALGAGGWLGGHLSYAQGVGVDNTVFEPDLDSWTRTELTAADLGEGRPRCATAGGVPILLVKEAGTVRAIANTCTHRGGPLHEGEYANGTITCPWHASVFSLEDGSVERGPATFPQPAYEARVKEGVVEVRARHNG